MTLPYWARKSYKEIGGGHRQKTLQGSVWALS